MKKIIKPIVIALGSSVILGAAALATAGEARDMQGNKVMINDETGFTYGGDGMGKYSEGKIATGKKDPAVCGSFDDANCSMAHIKK